MLELSSNWNHYAISFRLTIFFNSKGKGHDSIVNNSEFVARQVSRYYYSKDNLNVLYQLHLSTCDFISILFLCICYQMRNDSRCPRQILLDSHIARS